MDWLIVCLVFVFDLKGKKNYSKSSNSTKVEERKEEEREEIIIAGNVTSGDKQEEEKTNENTRIQQENQKNTEIIFSEQKQSQEQEKPLERSEKPDIIIVNEQTSQGNSFTVEKEDITQIKELSNNNIEDENVSASEKVEIISHLQFVQENSQKQSEQEIVSSLQQNNHIIQPIDTTQEQECKEQFENLASDNNFSNSNDIIASSSMQSLKIEENQKENQITQNSQQIPQVIEEKTKVLLTASENGKITEDPSLVMEVQIKESLVTQEQSQKNCKKQDKVEIAKIDKNDEKSDNNNQINTNTKINDNCKDNLAEDLTKNEREQEKQNGQILPVNQSQNNQSLTQVQKTPDSSSVEYMANKQITNKGVLAQKEEEEEADRSEVISSQDEFKITKKDFQQQSFQSPEIVRPNSSCCVIF